LQNLLDFDCNKRAGFGGGFVLFVVLLLGVVLFVVLLLGVVLFVVLLLGVVLFVEFDTCDTT
jgi:hypothetical protein